MESDFSLIPISGDKTLLQSSPFHGIGINCSPLNLQIPNKPLSISSSPLSLSSITTTSTKGDTGSQVHGNVSAYCNKENLNNSECKLGVPNLSVDRQKMKRSKRAGGYNLRKSLAWDRAFFTEEGVLNDSELSMITGCDRDSLCVINEQAIDSLPTKSGAICGSADEETLEEDLSEKLLSGHPSKRNDTYSSSIKQASVSRSAQKLSPSQGLKKAVCKDVCSTPMASTSQKRLFKSTRKFATRNSKIPKVQVSKKNPPLPSMIAIQSGGGGSTLKSCGIPQPDEQGRGALPVQSDAIYSSTDVEALEEHSSRNSPSGYPNKRNATSSSFMKQDAITGNGPASVSRSAQKVSPGHDLKKAASKEKSVLNSTRKILTRNSKTPKVQVSKKNPPVQSMTPTQSAAGGNSLKPSGIPQPVARQNLCSKLSSTIKRASSAAKTSLESMPKSIKPSADVGNDMVSSTLQMRPLMSHKAPNTTTGSNHLKNNPSDLLTAEAAIVKSSVGRSSTAALSGVQTDNAGLGLNKKSIEVQGNKPSGLRMPSPSLRFFSETKSAVSNISSQTNSMPIEVLKSSIPTSRNPKVVDHTSDLKPMQISEQALNYVDPTSKAEPCSQRTDDYPASSIVVPKVHAKVTQDTCNEQEVEAKVPLGCDDSKRSDDDQVRYDNLDSFEMKCKDIVPTSLKVKGQDCKGSEFTSSHVEFEKDSYKATILFQESRTADRSMLDASCESCPETQLIAACERNREIQSPQFEEVESNSLLMDDHVTSESQPNSTCNQNILMLSLDVDGRKTPDESCSSGLDQINFERSMEKQIGERNLLVDGKLEEDNSAVPGCLSGVLAVPESTVHEEVKGICNGNISVAGSLKYEHVEGEQGDMMLVNKLSNIKVCKSPEAQHEATENHVTRKSNATNFNDYNNKDSCTFSFEVGEPSHCTSTIPEVSNEHHVGFNHMCISDQGKGQHQVYRHAMVENRASVDDASIADEQCSEVTNGYTDVEWSQILNNEADMNYSIVAQESLSDIKHGEINARIFDDLDKVNNNEEEDKSQIDLHIHPPNFNDGSTYQTTHLEFQSTGMKSQDQVVIAVAEPNTKELLCPVNEHVAPPSIEECIESDKPGCNLATRETNGSTCNTEGMYDAGSTHQSTNLEFQSIEMRSQDQVVIAVAKQGTEELFCPVDEPVKPPSIESVGVTLEECIESDKVGFNLAPREAGETTCGTGGMYDDGSTHQPPNLEFQSTGMRSQDQVVIAAAEPDTEELLCSVNEDVTPTSIDSMQATVEDGIESDRVGYIGSVGATLEECIVSDEFGCNLSPRETDESTCIAEGTYDEGAITKHRTDDQLLTRPSPTAIPFSDEWLAAMESAGEEILTLKTGAVKHSPPDKSIPEPSPWSPVKRKTNQFIGPFDCTKYINS